MRKAVKRNRDGFIENIIEIEVDSVWKAPKGYTLIDAGDASPGDTWDGAKFIKPELPLHEPVRDLVAEIDEIKAKIVDYDNLKARVGELENK